MINKKISFGKVGKSIPNFFAVSLLIISFIISPFISAPVYAQGPSANWTLTGVLNTYHGLFHTTTLLQNGKVLIAGGFDAVTASAELYNSPLLQVQNPVINPIANNSLLEGTTYSSNDSFTNPGATSWIATVNYGDGTGVQLLPLSGQSFSLSHTYTLTVSVTNNQGKSGTASAIVTVNGKSLFGTGTYKSQPGWILPFPTISTVVTVKTNVINTNGKITGTTSFSGKVKGQTYIFKATSYQSLTINGSSSAILKGTGNINGANSTFLFVVNPITLIRLKVTDKTNHVVYDTQPGASDSANPTTQQTTGSVKIQ